MNIYSVCAASIIISVLSILLKKEYKELSFCISVVGSILIVIYILNYLSPVFEQLNELIKLSEIDSGTIGIILKSCGICFIAEFCSNVCRDSGENTIAFQIETAARIVVLFLSLPLIKTVVGELIKFTEV